MYANTSKRKFLNFTLLIGSLAACIILTAFVRSSVNGEYISTGWLGNSTRIAWNSVVFRIRESDQSGFLADIRSFFGASSGSGVASASDTTAQDIPVLLYHGITNTPGRYNMTQERFFEEMKALKNDGWRTITLQQFEDFMNGKQAPTGKVFLLTFDDGRTDSYVGADPVLQALGFTAVMFTPTTDTIDSPTASFKTYYLNTATLKAMVASGRWEIGSHAIQKTPKPTGGYIPIAADGSTGYFLSNKMWLADQNRLETDDEYKARVTDELVNSKKKLEDTLGVSVSAFAYPFSDYGQASTNNLANARSVIQSILEQNYTVAFQQTSPKDNNFSSNYPGLDPMHLRRIEPAADSVPQDLIQKLDAAMTKNLPFQDNFNHPAELLYNWGAVQASANYLRLQALPDSNGVLTFIDGTHAWTDYAYTVSGRWEAGNDLSLIARYKSDGNYVSCDFRDGKARIIENINSQPTLLTEQDNGVILPKSNLALAMAVSGSSVKCYEGSRLVASIGNLDKSLEQGGVAMSVWSPTPNNASATIVSLNAAPAAGAADLLDQLPVYGVKISTPAPTPPQSLFRRILSTPAPTPTPSPSDLPFYSPPPSTPSPSVTPSPIPSPSPSDTPPRHRSPSPSPSISPGPTPTSTPKTTSSPTPRHGKNH